MSTDKQVEVIDGAPSGDTSAQEAPIEDEFGPVEAKKKDEEKQVELDKDKYKNKGKSLESPVLVAIDTAKTQSLGIFPQFNINFDKPFTQISSAGRMIVVAALQVQASQDLAQSESEENKLIEKSVKVLGQVILEVKLDANTSTSSKLNNLIDHISSKFHSLSKASA